MLLGTTYKHKQISWLSLNNEVVFTEIVGLKFDIIRLGVYWSDVQKSKDVFNFDEIKKLLDICEDKKQKVLVTIGMKAPGWPEYYIPNWAITSKLEDISKYLYSYFEKTLFTLKHYKCIYAWQIENEPLDPSGPNKQIIPIEILKNEYKIIKNIDPNRNIIINIWGNNLRRNKNINKIIKISDMIGLDLYYKQFIKRVAGISFYLGPLGSLESTNKYIQKFGKKLWITELQAEPWEERSDFYLSKNPGSINPKLLKENYVKALKLNPDAILFWGCEYWLWKKSQGDDNYLEIIKNIINEHKNA